jgi:hypothetical protein
MTQNTQDRKSIPASEFVRNFGRYRDRAASGEVLRVSSHGRIIGAYLSAQELARFETLKRRERESLDTAKLPDDIVEAIRSAEYGKVPE